MSTSALAAELLEATVHHDMARAVDLVRAHAEVGGRISDAVEALADVQRRVGDLWASDEWNVADEHAASAIVDGALAALELATRSEPDADKARSVLVACPEGEWHTLPARMLAASLRALGAEVVFLGASMPADHLAGFASRHRPDIVALSVSTPLPYLAAAAAIDAVHAAGVPVVLGGRAMGSDESRSLALGADGWAGDAAGLLDRPPDLAPSTPSQLEARAEREATVLALELERPSLLERAMEQLRELSAPMADHDRRQLQHTRRDLDSIAHVAESSILVADPQVFSEFLEWLMALLEARRVPRLAVTRSLEALRDASSDDRFRDLVADALQHLR